MIITAPLRIKNADSYTHNDSVRLQSNCLKANAAELRLEDAVLMPPMINCHDHLVGDWYPRSGENRPYVNSHIWVEDMKQSKSYLERNKVWINDGSFELHKGTAKLIVSLGVYKNVFSGVGVVQDHAPNQIEEYYEGWPIHVLEKYRQGHSITLNNWWGGDTLEDELSAANCSQPFIIHLAEGTDDVTRGEFAKLVERNLLKHNTVIVHGVALTEDEIAQTAEVGATICWCPASNDYLLGEHLNVSACRKLGVNLVLGTDSTQTGSVNMFSELREAHKFEPNVPARELFGMVSENARRALHLDASHGVLADDSPHLLAVRRYHSDPYENLLHVDKEDVLLMVYNGKPVYGLSRYLDHFDVDCSDFDFFHLRGEDRFVAGHPLATVAEIDSKLGYHKNFPFLPF